MTAVTADNATVTTTVAKPVAATRLLALDVFRGATIAAMLLVNDPGTWSAVYAPLLHAPWHGWTPTDLIFPFFLFIVGITTALSLDARRARGATNRDLTLQVLRRGAVIVGLGLFLSGFPFFATGTIDGNADPTFLERVGDRLEHWRFPGVLQRIGVAYMIGALLWLRTTFRQQVGITATLLLGYWILMTLVPVPGTGKLGYETLGDPSGSIAAWLDRTVFGTNHLWRQARTWDPEGLLSTLPAIGTVLLGIFAGRTIGSSRPLSERLNALFAWGVAGVIAGAVWGWFFPINKSLWTSSFTIFTAGAGVLVLGFCIWAIDVRGWRRWTTPLLVFGVNPILAYVGAGLMARLIYSLIRVPSGDGGTIAIQAAIYRAAYASWLPPKLASLAFALSFVAFWFVVLYPLWKKRIYLKV